MLDQPRPDDPSGRRLDSGPDPAPDTPAAWLLQALGSLPADQRETVLQWLFDRIPGAATPQANLAGTWPTPTPSGFTHRHRHRAQLAADELMLRVSDSLRGDYQMVPVRLPVGDHARLRAWSQQHGFAMATVIRGLLARFLDEQQPGTAQPSGAGD